MHSKQSNQLLRNPMMDIFLSVIAMMISSSVCSQTTAPANALATYVNHPDTTYRWEVRDSMVTDDIVSYKLLLTSQSWRTIKWNHQLTVIVPRNVKSPTALLYIAGGAIDEQGMPRLHTSNEDRHLRAAKTVAIEQGTVAAVLRQTPNQPLFGGKKEDELISMTLHQFQLDGDYSWPLLFPMVKSAVRAMDATQAFLQHRQVDIHDYVVTGLSKRGWTTWLTAAVDDRVAAIAPMVIDVLHMPVSLQYQIDTWGTYSPEIRDYVALGIPQQAASKKGKDLITMIDPYAYRHALNMPKILLMGTNDPYWVVDNVKNYLDSIPGVNQLHYVPNAGHDLGDGVQATHALSAFVGQVVSKTGHPPTFWNLIHKARQSIISLNTNPHTLEDIVLWEASSADRDFRTATWNPVPLRKKSATMQRVKLKWPKEGYRAYYVDKVYRTPTGNTYSQSTRVFLFDNKGLL
ncbi:PhoPQ-activated pathogenicity-related family protein [Sphingobacterium haloxyli]|uniref:PhoPQ-activated pathogenicity-like protein PqaA type n=1 Tax=Sphingobacterium haloxyli TaxID=2100533 RepID=A0A2S9IYB3_9SPHI|nr:PhoPQ-activated protein PqaA family protein [Sphingobacterium haloxyli]PRD45522.1 PhoPQ-activated pathogenicity-like protein PqaA type [Sphingobacterium haloxyli]